MTVTRAEARAIAAQEMERLFLGSAIEPVIVDSDTDEADFGWVFYYQSRRYLETGRPSDRLVGNEPLVVDRHGRLHRLPTSAPPDVGIQRLREAGAFKAP
jgi:hypothetical protein